MKVIFIGGSSRSGTTLLDVMLGGLDGFFSLGEMYHVWERGFIENELCGCGTPFLTCGFWEAVTRSAFGDPESVSPHGILRLARRVQRIKFIPQMLCRKLRTSSYAAAWDEYSSILERLYSSIAMHSNASYLIDSSKAPAYGFMLNSIPALDVYVIHIVRDSRAVAYSWQRKKIRPEIHWETQYMPRAGLVGSTSEWLISNSLNSLLGASAAGYICVRYEDLAMNPEGILATLVDWLDLDLSLVSHVVTDGSVTLRPNHTVSGNPVRFREGKVPIVLDDAWRSQLNPWKKALVLAGTWPLQSYCRYRAAGPMR